jgi:hypothetical protein
MELNRGFSEFIASCAHDVRYLIVGGYAVAAHGHPVHERPRGCGLTSRTPTGAVTTVDTPT